MFGKRLRAECPYGRRGIGVLAVAGSAVVTARPAPHDVNLILPFGEVVAGLGMQGERPLGLETLQRDSLAGPAIGPG